MKTIEFSLRVASEVNEKINDVPYFRKNLRWISSNVYEFEDDGEIDDNLIFQLNYWGISEEEYEIY